MERYVLSSNGYNPGYTISRWYIDNYRAFDYFSPVYIAYGGRVVPSNPIVFESMEEIEIYIKYSGRVTDGMNIVKHRNDSIPKKFQIVRYNPGMNALENEIYGEVEIK